MPHETPLSTNDLFCLSSQVKNRRAVLELQKEGQAGFLPSPVRLHIDALKVSSRKHAGR